MIKELMETQYAPFLEDQLVHGMNSASVDEALKDGMVAAYRKVLGFLDKNSQVLLRTLLGRWDTFNVKTILRGAHNHVATADVIDSLLPVGYLGTGELEALAKIDDVRAVIDTAAMWKLPLAPTLRQMYPDYARTNDLAPLELALDREYTEWAASRLHGSSSGVDITRLVLTMQVDTSNLVTAFRMVKEEVDMERAEQYFLEGGRGIRKSLFLDLTRMSDVDEILDKLKPTVYGEALDAAAVPYLETQSITVFERALEEALMKRALGAGIRDPYGVGVAIAFLWGKQNEVTNLRIIVRGKEVGMPADRTRRELILV
jgi:V/A-type H+/Na+-transporting ATPase subunit C